MMTREEKLLSKFIEKSTEKHSGKYDYSKVIAGKQSIPVEIICPIHGSFFQRKDVHVKGGGCKKCLYESMKGPKMTTEEYLQKVISRHGHKFDYSKVEYKGSNELITVVCKTHGEFKQSAAHHYALCACPSCSYDEYRLSQEDFIEKATSIHKGFYDYSLVNLTQGFKEKIDIICPVHGKFSQVAGAHMLGNGCAKCGVDRSLKSRYSDFTTEYFIERAKEVHGDRYNYSLAEYVNTDTKIKIICEKHGVFEQRPLCHTRGKGCIKCRNDKTTYNFIQKYREDKQLGSKLGLIYILSIFNDVENFIKVGITSNKNGRFKRYRKQLKEAGYSFEVLYEKSMPNYQTAMLENEILKSLRKEHKLYEPVEYFSGRSECVLKENLQDIINMIEDHNEEVYFE